MFPGPENISRTLSSLRWVGSMMHEKRGEQPPTQQCTVQACALERARTGNETTIGHWPACVARRDGRRATGSLDRGCGANFPETPGISSRPPTDTSSARLFARRQLSHPRSSISPRRLPAQRCHSITARSNRDQLAGPRPNPATSTSRQSTPLANTDPIDLGAIRAHPPIAPQPSMRNDDDQSSQPTL